MRKKSTRLLSAALAVCMMLSVLPVGAFAAEPGAEEQENGASAQADPVLCAPHFDGLAERRDFQSAV